MNTVSESMSFQDVGRYSIQSSCLTQEEIGIASTSVVLNFYCFSSIRCCSLSALCSKSFSLIGFYITLNVPFVICEHIQRLRMKALTLVK
jgi:hypothetical protein